MRHQKFYVDMHNEATGETRGITVEAADPPAALQKLLRRRRFAEALCSEQPYRFVVEDASVSRSRAMPAKPPSGKTESIVRSGANGEDVWYVPAAVLRGLATAVQVAHVGMDERNPDCEVCRWLNRADAALSPGEPAP